MGLIDHITVERVLLSDFYALRSARAQGSTRAILDWLQRHTGLDRDALLEFGIDEVAGIVDRLHEETTYEPSMEEQRNVRRLNRGTAKEAPVWMLYMRMADGDPLLAQRYERELTKVWYERKIVYDRGGPEGEYLTGKPN